jgi:predicted Fe-S protein YdhL (DUF1289 family)
MDEVNGNEEVQSPCIGVCAIDDGSQLCQGCYRTLDEIQGWRDLDNAQKTIVAESANQRATALFD